MNKLTENLGVELANKIIGMIPGQRVFVSSGGYISGISKWFNRKEAVIISAFYGGRSIDIPLTTDATDKNIRNQRIIKRLQSGSSINQVVSEFKLSRRQVFQIKRDSSNENV